MQTVMAEPPADPRGSVRANDQPLARPKDAATLVLYRRRGHGIEVLMGERHANHRFMPNHYVFPGGRVDRGDARVRAASELDGRVAGRLARACTPVRARALALAAVRETFEEVGLRLGRPDPRPGKPVPAGWRGFFEAGLAPTLEPLEYVARAVTPPYRPIRFNARFFMADAQHAAGDIRGSGELENIHWVPIAEARGLPIPGITGLVLEIIEDRVKTGRPATDGTIVLFQYRHGRHTRGVE